MEKELKYFNTCDRRVSLLNFSWGKKEKEKERNTTLLQLCGALGLISGQQNVNRSHMCHFQAKVIKDKCALTIHPYILFPFHSKLGRSPLTCKTQACIQAQQWEVTVAVEIISVTKARGKSSNVMTVSHSSRTSRSTSYQVGSAGMLGQLVQAEALGGPQHEGILGGAPV